MTTQPAVAVATQLVYLFDEGHAGLSAVYCPTCTCSSGWQRSIRPADNLTGFLGRVGISRSYPHGKLHTARRNPSDSCRGAADRKRVYCGQTFNPSACGSDHNIRNGNDGEGAER